MTKPLLAILLLLNLGLANLYVSTAHSSQISISSGGVDIHYEVHGEGEPTLVFIHGWSCDRSYWQAQVEYFAKQYQVITIDLAGHGESGTNRSEWNLRDYGTDVVSVVNALQLEKLVLVGHSLGGHVALEAASLMQEKVLMVIGADSLHDLSATFSEEEMMALSQAMETDFRATAEDMVRSQMFLPEANISLIEAVASDIGSAPPAIAIDTLKGYDRWTKKEREETLAKLRVPIHVINSEEYRGTNIAAAKGLAYSFEATLMPKIGHFVMLENPSMFNKLLAELIESVANNVQVTKN